jgi:hypothetical protein
VVARSDPDRKFPAESRAELESHNPAVTASAAANATSSRTRAASPIGPSGGDDKRQPSQPNHAARPTAHSSLPTQFANFVTVPPYSFHYPIVNWISADEICDLSLAAVVVPSQ